MTTNKNIGIMIAGPFYLNMPSLFEMSAPTLRNGEKGKATYNQECVFDLEDPEQKAAFKAVQAKALEVIRDKFGPDATLTEVPGQFKFRAPWKMGDKKADELEAKDKDGSFYRGKVFFRASTTFEPNLGMVKGNQVVEEVSASDLYSGCLAKSEINITVMAPISSEEDAKGFIKIYLNGTVKVGEGKRLSGRSKTSVLSAIAGVAVNESVDDEDEEIVI